MQKFKNQYFGDFCLQTTINLKDKADRDVPDNLSNSKFQKWS